MGAPISRIAVESSRATIAEQFTRWASVIPWVLVVALLWPGARLLAQSQEIAPADQASFQQAMAAVDAGNGAEAKPVLETLHHRYPHNFEINESLGLLYASSGDLSTALPLFEAAAVERPNSDAVAANLGIAYLKAGKNAEASQALELSVSLNPQNLAAEEALGQALMGLGQAAKAAKVFHRALLVDTENPSLLYNAALADYETGDAAHAAALLGHLPDTENSAEAQSLMGDVEEKLGDYKSAAQHYLNAARLAPTEANEFAVGAELLRHWTFSAAVTQFEGGVQRFPDSRRMRLGLGIAYFGNHNYEKAIPVFAALLADEPDNASYADLLGRTCTVAIEGNDPRCAALIAFAKSHPQDGKAATYAATHILHQPENGPEQREEARTFLAQALAADPKIPEANYQMGLLLGMEEKWKESIPYLEKAVSLEPDYAVAHYHLAIAYRRTGQNDKAQTEIQLEQKYSAQNARQRDLKLEQIQTLLLTK
jgi:tetratricopeptide (TPR) repeat protein